MNVASIVQVAQAAHRMGEDFPGPLSGGEAVTAALVLNRHDWLKQLRQTIPSAINRVDQDTPGNLFNAQEELRRSGIPIGMTS